MSKTVFFDNRGCGSPQGKRTSGIYMYWTCQSQCEVREAIKYGF